MSKLRRAPGLSAAARKVLSNVEARTRNVPGTHEVRTTMRQQTHAYRVSYGAALFITFSPSERDSAIMVRMARARHTDPAIAQDEFKAFYGREKPQLDVEFCRLSPERLAEARHTSSFMSLLNPPAVFSLACPCTTRVSIYIDGPASGIANLRSATGTASEGPACLRLRLPSLGGSCSATHLRLALLPAMPRLQLLGPALRRCIRQQRDR